MRLRGRGRSHLPTSVPLILGLSIPEVFLLDLIVSSSAIYQPILVDTGSYDAIFYGTDSTNQGAALASFIHTNQGLNIAVDGIVRCEGNATTAAVLLDSMASGVGTTTISFINGGKLYCTGISYGVLNFWDAYDIVVNDCVVDGIDQYVWDGGPTGEDPNGVMDGFGIYGGGNITLNNPTAHDTRGDGIFIGNNGDGFTNPVNIVVNNVTLYRNARNGITVNAGVVQVHNGTIANSGLHSIDMEPNTTAQAASIDAWFDNLRMDAHDDITGFGGPAGTGYCVAGGPWGGGSGTNKINVAFTDCSADEFTSVLAYSAAVTFTGNSSDVLIDGGWAGGGIGPYEFDTMGTKTVSGNTNMQNPDPYT